MENPKWDTLCIEVSCSELLQMVTGLINTAEKLVSMRAPVSSVNQTISSAEKFNRILMKAGYDHWTKQKFIELKEKAHYEGVQ